MAETKQLVVTTEQQGLRIDKVVAEALALSRTQVQTFIKDGLLLVNDQQVKPNYKLQLGDQITVTPPEPKVLEVQAENIPLEIIYEDQDVAVVNKPQGMVVHPSAGHESGTLVNALMYHLHDLSSINGWIRPGIVHRIDKDTSGLLMIAKNDAAHEFLADQLANKTNKRRYLALVHGNFGQDLTGTVNAPIGRNPKDRKKQAIVANGKPSVTHYEVLEQFSNYSLVACELETGRTHQIRVHLASIGHPLAGDPVYGPRKTLKGAGQFLHAETLGFIHPTTKQLMEFQCEPPQIFQTTLAKLRQLNTKT